MVEVPNFTTMLLQVNLLCMFLIMGFISGTVTYLFQSLEY